MIIGAVSGVSFAALAATQHLRTRPNAALFSNFFADYRRSRHLPFVYVISGGNIGTNR
jgi:hypothetical protein